MTQHKNEPRREGTGVVNVKRGRWASRHGATGGGSEGGSQGECSQVWLSVSSRRTNGDQVHARRLITRSGLDLPSKARLCRSRRVHHDDAFPSLSFSSSARLPHRAPTLTHLQAISSLGPQNTWPTFSARCVSGASLGGCGYYAGSNEYLCISVRHAVAASAGSTFRRSTDSIQSSSAK